MLVMRFRAAARRLREDAGGLALVEFAFSLPIVLTLGLVGLETAHYALAHLRVSNIAMMTADNASRVRDSIDESDVNELMLGSILTGETIGFEPNGRIVLSSIELNAAENGQWIRWQRCAGSKNAASRYGAQGAGRTDASIQGMGPAGNRIAAQPGTAVLVAEVFYDYQPIVPNTISGGTTISYVSAFNVRQRNDQAIRNAASVTVSSC